jgi:hypothetical protein
VVDRLSPNSRQGLSRQQESLVAVFYGACCHVCFVAGVGTMMIMMFFGMSRSFGVLHAPWSYLANALLLAQFPLLHSMLLSRRGRRGLGPPGATGAGRASSHDNLRLDRRCPGLAALCLVVAERDGLVAGERLCVRRAVLPLCCSLAAAAEVDHRRRLRAADRSAGMAGRGAPSGPGLPTDADHGSVSAVPAADLRRLRPDALDGSDDYAGPTRRLLGADRLLRGRSLVQGGAVRAAFGEPFTRYQQNVPYWLPWAPRRAAVPFADNVLAGAKANPTSGELCSQRPPGSRRL